MTRFQTENLPDCAGDPKAVTPEGTTPSVNWQVYIICCSDGTLYTGITTDLARRFRQHREGEGAKYFRGRRPDKVIYTETGHTRSSAAVREAQIKSLTRCDKLLLATAAQNHLDGGNRHVSECACV